MTGVTDTLPRGPWGSYVGFKIVSIRQSFMISFNAAANIIDFRPKGPWAPRTAEKLHLAIELGNKLLGRSHHTLPAWHPLASTTNQIRVQISGYLQTWRHLPNCIWYTLLHYWIPMARHLYPSHATILAAIVGSWPIVWGLPHPPVLTMRKCPKDTDPWSNQRHVPLLRPRSKPGRLASIHPWWFVGKHHHGWW